MIIFRHKVAAVRLPRPRRSAAVDGDGAPEGGGRRRLCLRHQSHPVRARRLRLYLESRV